MSDKGHDSIMTYYLVCWEDADICETCSSPPREMYVVAAKTEWELFRIIEVYDDARAAQITELPSGPFAINAIRFTPPLEGLEESYGDMLIGRIPMDGRNDLR